MSHAFLEQTDLIAMFKECTPAYASDRHAGVERVIRTIREAAERGLREIGRPVTNRELEMLVALIVNEAENELQACGTSAAQRAYGYSTSYAMSLLQHEVMPAPTQLLYNQQLARKVWREAANDRKFQQLLVKQLGPQLSSAYRPEQGELVYYWRPNPLNDGPVWHGPAEVTGRSDRSNQAQLTHGGLLVRAAY